MNFDRIEGNWKQVKGNAKQTWGKLIGDRLGVIMGKRERMAGKIQEAFGIGKDRTEAELIATQKDIDQRN